ncbi:MAG: hypothetical protein ACI9K2_006044, partial [Myxococcota bacterium]
RGSHWSPAAPASVVGAHVDAAADASLKALTWRHEPAVIPS